MPLLPVVPPAPAHACSRPPAPQTSSTGARGALLSCHCHMSRGASGFACCARLADADTQVGGEGCKEQS
eukprot:3401217-Alexandrium_andersonii.AAC.1